MYKNSKSLPFWIVNAFSRETFSGNPAAVCILEEWVEDELLQKISAQNNLSETAFLVDSEGEYSLRWFTPTTEVDLCGHATLAAAKVLDTYFREDTCSFSTRSGILETEVHMEMIQLNFPLDTALPNTDPIPWRQILGQQPLGVYRGKDDYMVVLPDEESIIALSPDMSMISKLRSRGLIVTARGNNCDFVSRFFAPQSGIAEDPVTGSVHTLLSPYWSHVLGKTNLEAAQLSTRKGYMLCQVQERSVLLSGHAEVYAEG